MSDQLNRVRRNLAKLGRLSKRYFGFHWQTEKRGEPQSDGERARTASNAWLDRSARCAFFNLPFACEVVHNRRLNR